MRNRAILPLIVIVLLALVALGVLSWNRYNSQTTQFKVTIDNRVDETVYQFDPQIFFSGSLFRQLGDLDEPQYVEAIEVILTPTYFPNMSGRNLYTIKDSGEEITASAVSIGHFSGENTLVLTIYINEKITDPELRTFFINSSFMNGYFYGLELVEEKKSEGQYQADYKSASEKSKSAFADYLDTNEYFITANEK